MHNARSSAVWFGVGLNLLFACAAEVEAPGRGPAAQSGGGSAAPSQAGSAAAAAAAPMTDGPLGLAGTPAPVANAGSGAPDPNNPEMCAGTSITAPPSGMPKVDIVWVVDASGSMVDEQAKIGLNLTQFAEQISMASIDVRIVMMTTVAAIPVICPIVPADPLAGTPLASDPRYRFIEQGVDSENALDIAVSAFPMYSTFLRPDAVTHFMIVSDDESSYKGMGDAAARASAFRADMMGLLQKDFILHTISSEGPVACGDANCMPDPNTGICFFVMLQCGAARPGTTYYALAEMTKGLTASICQHDWKTIFEPLTTAVIESAPLPCNYKIPAAPVGQTLEAGKVNVRWTSPARTDEIFGRATDQSACADKAGWYYDDPSKPTEVLLCPTACERVAAGGTVNIAFGCESILLL